MSKAKPVELKKGNLTKDVYEERKSNEDKLKGSKPISKKSPAYLCENGRKIYKNIVKSLPEDFLNNTDEYVVAIVADSLAKMQECQQLIKKEGLLVEYTNTAGATNIDQNKAVLIYQKYCEIFKKYIGEIGLSPSARSKMALMISESDAEKQDPLLQVLAGGRNG